jgi:HSP20 family protein
MMILKRMPLRGTSCGHPSFASKFDREFDTASRGYTGNSYERYPATDILDTDEDYVLKMEIPGFSKNDVNIEFKENILSIKGERKDEEKEGVQKERYHWAERRDPNFSRSFRFPKNVDGKKINARIKDGILELRVPKPEDIKPKNIPINIH